MSLANDIVLPSLKKSDALAPTARQQRNNKVWLCEGGEGGCVDGLPFGGVLLKLERLGSGFSLYATFATQLGLAFF